MAPSEQPTKPRPVQIEKAEPAYTAVSCLRPDEYEQGPYREFAIDGTLVTDGWFEGSVLAKTWTRWDHSGKVLVVQRFSDKPRFDRCVKPDPDREAD